MRIELAGQEKIHAYRKSAFASGRLPPAILLVGAPVSGKASLALEFAKQHLCECGTQFPDEPPLAPCGECFACRETAKLRYPDFIMFSARELAPACRALEAIMGSARVRPLLFETEFLARRVVQHLRSGFFKLKDVSAKEAESIGEKIAALETLTPDIAPESLTLADEENIRERLAEAINTISELDALSQHAVLPIAGIQEIIRLLARRPLLGHRRVVFIEEIEKFRSEGANAFLKTLEEPPPDTLILMTASNIEAVLPTIRSRSAILPVTHFTKADIRSIAFTYYGLPEEDEPLGYTGRDLYAYLESAGDTARILRNDLQRFLDLIQTADRDPACFEFAHDMDKRKAAPAFLFALSERIAETITARALDQKNAQSDLLAHYRGIFLRRMLREIRTLARGIRKNNFSAAQGIIAIMQAFWLEGAMP
jgi:DNA polymerase III delta prime subunit